VCEREYVCVCEVCYIDEDFDALCITDCPGYYGTVGVCVRERERECVCVRGCE